MFLYKIENKINKKTYVGVTIDFKRRWREHKNNLNRGKHCNNHLQYAWKKYGKENFIFEILNEFDNLEDMNKAEVGYIRENRLNNNSFGYNIHKGGNCFKHTEESRVKISKSNEKSVISRCLKTGVFKIYNKVGDVKEDGYIPGSLSNACTGRNLTYKQKVWAYKQDYDKNPDIINDKYKKYKNKNLKARPNTYKKVYGMCLKTKEIKEYAAIDHVKRDGFACQNVRICCRNNPTHKTHKKWVWSFDVKDLETKYNVAINRTTHRVI